MTDHIKTMLNRIYANKPQKDYFSSEAEKKTLSHAYIIEGPRGSGKYMMAKCVCALIAGDERASLMIDDNNAPDVTTVDAEENKKLIGIDQIRGIRRDAYIKPNDFDFKAYIIRNSDRMTVQAQNSILKLLEEPPQGVYFFLLTENSSALLPTVRSRAPVIRMQLLSSSELSGYLTGHDKRAADLQKSDPEALERVVRTSQTIGEALERLENAHLEESGGAIGAAGIMELLVQKKKTSFFMAVNALPAKREDLVPTVNALMSMTRDMIYIKHTRKTDELISGSDPEIAGLARRMTAASLISIYDALERASADLASNMNVQNVKSVMAGSLWKSL